MKTRMMTVILAVALSAALTSTAYAGDEFEKGFKWELGAITARSAVGLGVGVVNGVFGGGVAYNGYYVRPTPVRYYPQPYYSKTVVYAPPPVYRVERRVYYQAPPPPVRTYEYRYYGYR